MCPLGPGTQILGKPLAQLRLAGPESLNGDFTWGRKIMNFLDSIRGRKADLKKGLEKDWLQFTPPMNVNIEFH